MDSSEFLDIWVVCCLIKHFFFSSRALYSVVNSFTVILASSKLIIGLLFGFLGYRIYSRSFLMFWGSSYIFLVS